jgi:hypothetical protein
MRGIKELRQRVLAAEERVGQNDAQRAEYSERLVVLMNGIEERIRDQQGKIKQQTAVIRKHKSEAVVQQAKIDGQGTAIAQQAETIEKLKAAGDRKTTENEQLRAMLQSMLQAIESDGRDGLAEAMQELDRKVSALMSAAVAEPEAEETGAAIDEPPVETAIAVGPVSIGPIEAFEAEEAPRDEAVTEPEPEPEAEPEIAATAGIEEPAAETEEPVAEEIEEPAAETEEPVAEEIEEPAAEEIDEPVSEEVEEPLAEEAATATTEDEAGDEAGDEAAIATGDILDTDEIVPETAGETTGEATGEVTGTIGGSLDEIMERVSKLVEETEAAAEDSAEESAEDSAEDSAGDSVEEVAEEPAQQATGTDS